MACAWGEAGDECCPYVTIIGTSIASVLASVGCMALALYIWQPRVTPSMPSAQDDGPVRITLPQHLSAGSHSTPMALDIHIYPPATGITATTTSNMSNDIVMLPSSSRRHKQTRKMSKSRPVSSSSTSSHHRQPSLRPTQDQPYHHHHHPMDSINNYFSTGRPSSASYRQSTVVSHFSTYAFSELSSEASNNNASSVEATSTYIPIMDEPRHVCDGYDPRRLSSRTSHESSQFVDTSSQVSSNASFLTTTKSFEKLSLASKADDDSSRQARSTKPSTSTRPENARRLSTRARVDSDMLSSMTGTPFVVPEDAALSVVSSTAAQVTSSPRERPRAPGLDDNGDDCSRRRSRW
ncbi:hypothetical protein H257_07336 [Aphanomyces astaci]|uniref:Uncharacterized protein n=1 Tax=Aphanomyces astaci TaxID=112090 RepID=W4GHY6_APHAT|nr:hypothetical protein H257_07336 [Aphanomyces astaci]ETV79282.1 hypothetical protein H257_07336 [Aphanomyces astaci]RQM22259.1 hypothetical protein B5M09_008964 [Aphanomyces astaci]|eukprot:XP_009831123.1 hypothetical protein H257_07336 [Aphanomyces astaci]